VALERLQIRVLGVVQGVGFRPFVHRLAHELSLAGFVCNDAEGVIIEIEGEHASLLEFLHRLARERPSASIVYAVDHRFARAQGATWFEIRPSREGAPSRSWILPDLAICSDCKAELLDPRDRRHDYPFLNCTNCGPRFTIIEALPYDRARTSMHNFAMCAQCRAEYEDPQDRRFHAQPTACPACGPRLRYEGAGTDDILQSEDALGAAAAAIERGGIVALKGLGGYHVVVDAANESAVSELRHRKGRPFKPFALMYPDLVRLRRHVELPTFVEPLLESSQAPIVILPRTMAGREEIAHSVAPRAPTLGVFLPYTPLHVLLLREFDRPLVATSGNLTDQPTLHDDEQARRELGGICDGFLTHDRPILRQADDSVLHVLQHPEPRVQMLRRARGYTPLPVLAPQALPPILALGGQMNTVFAFSRGREIVLSQHLGEMESHESRESYRRTLEDLLRLYEVQPGLIAHDLHPDYFSTQLAEEFRLPRHGVQHHHAHLAAAMLEHELEEDVLGLTWDGTGYGLDGTVWGGEALMGGAARATRVGSLWSFCLPGGEAAVEQTWRTALALLWESYGEELPRDLPLFAIVEEAEVELVLQMLRRGLNSPRCSSMGRLFDGVSALLGLSYENTHQAQSPQLLEYAAWAHGPSAESLPLELTRSPEPSTGSMDRGGRPDRCSRLDWRELIRELVARWRRGHSAERLAASFHRSLVDGAHGLVREHGRPSVVMSGGVFCNRYLSEALLRELARDGVRAYVHTQLPPTDGCLAAGQLWVAAHRGRLQGD
jgi:hydrogenase maturation protein HypF